MAENFMIITAFTLEFLQGQKVKISWTGTIDHLTWIFLNGVPVSNPWVFGSVTAREAEFDVPEKFNLELHEAAEGEEILAFSSTVDQFPIFFWSPVSVAEIYLIYRTPQVGGEELLLQDTEHAEDRDFYKVISIKDLIADGGVWNLFRVEAVTTIGKESVRSPFFEFIKGLPAVPQTAVLSGTAPTMTLTLTI